MSDIADWVKELSVSNVYFYIGDAVRWDAFNKAEVPDGVEIKTVASSTASPASFGSITSGLYPSSHGIFDWSDQLATTPTYLDLPGVDTRFVNSIQGDPTAKDPIYSLLSIEPNEDQFDFTDLSEPFFVIERGPGGHAPYDSPYGNARLDYFREVSKKTSKQLQSEYDDAVKFDLDRFESRLSELSREGLSEDTLVVYCSDHGELLGEDGLLGHTDPMRPELVYVPALFCHPSLDSYTVSGRVIRHVDLVPTALDLLNESLHTARFDGNSLVTKGNSKYGFSIWRNTFGKGTALESELYYEGVFDAAGGQVFTRSDFSDHLKVSVGKLIKSPKRPFYRRNVLPMLRSYLGSGTTYGKPAMSRKEATTQLDNIELTGSQSRRSLSEEEKQRLKNLGYIQ